jgi:hypothetical protein
MTFQLPLSALPFYGSTVHAKHLNDAFAWARSTLYRDELALSMSRCREALREGDECRVGRHIDYATYKFCIAKWNLDVTPEIGQLFLDYVNAGAVDVNAPIRTAAQDVPAGTTPMQLAIRYGNCDAAAALVMAGATEPDEGYGTLVRDTLSGELAAYMNARLAEASMLRVLANASASAAARIAATAETGYVDAEDEACAPRTSRFRPR